MEQMLKRKVEDEVKTTNILDNLNNDEFDLTYGGKKPRYLYNYSLQSFDVKSNATDDTESVLSIQSKSTVEAYDDEDLSSVNCGSDCNCGDYHSEYDVLSSSSSSTHKIHYSDSSDSSTEVEIMITQNLQNLSYDENFDNGYLPDDTDIQVLNISTKKLPPPACFQFCLQCGKINPNPYYQYCYLCYRYRKEFFVNKPVPKKKSIKYSQDSGISITHNKKKSINTPQSSISLSAPTYLSSNENIKNKTILGNDNKIELCNICLVNPKNGVFNHGRIGHIYSCYLCSKKIWTKTNKCPICQQKIQFLTKIVNT